MTRTRAPLLILAAAALVALLTSRTEAGPTVETYEPKRWFEYTPPGCQWVFIVGEPKPGDDLVCPRSLIPEIRAESIPDVLHRRGR